MKQTGAQSQTSTGRLRSGIRRAVGRLPAPREEAALGLLRNARALVKGTPPPGGAPVKAKEMAAPQPVGEGIPGRWMRVITTPADVEHPLDREVSDPAEAAAVRAGWLLIDAYERMSPTAAEKVFKHELDAWYQYTDDAFVALKHPANLDPAHIQEGKGNQLRYRRTMDFVRPGDRVFDVGFGRGYLAAQLVKTREVESYDGIDLTDACIPSAREMFEANGLTDASIELKIGDLFDLTPEHLAAVNATFVICCEVMEHVDDAERALRILGDALPDGTDLLFSVPLHGRLESVWGHASVFDVARLKQMLDGAGLFAHHVEPVANTWSLIIASRDPEPSVRVREASRRPAVRASVPLVAHRVFVDIHPSEMSLTSPDTAELVSHHRYKYAAVCRLGAGGGISFPVNGLEALRLMIEFTDIEHVQRFVVTARKGKKKVCTWVWTPEPKQLVNGTRRFSLRPGELTATFVSGPHKQVKRADRVDLVVELAAGKSAEFGMRAAYLP